METNEHWKPIPGFEGLYEVSDWGRVKSLSRLVVRREKPPMTIRERILKAGPVKGYPRVNLSRQGMMHPVDVHLLVLLAFRGPCPPGHEGRHLNGNPSENQLDNLAYGTRAQNIEDAKRHGTFPLHENRPGALLTKDSVKEISQSTEPAKVLAERYGVRPNAIYQVWAGLTWRDITEGLRRSHRRSGEGISGAKLTESQVHEILTSKGSARALARHFHVNRSTISHIRSGKTWQHVPRL